MDTRNMTGQYHTSKQADDQDDRTDLMVLFLFHFFQQFAHCSVTSILFSTALHL